MHCNCLTFRITKIGFLIPVVFSLFFFVSCNRDNKEWSIQVLNSTLKNSESISNQINITPEPDKAIAKIDLEVIALKGEIGRLRERLLPEKSFINSNVVEYLSGKMPENINTGLWGAMHKPADVSKIETQLFLSKNVKLINNESSILPQFAQIEGYGTTMTDNGQFSWGMEDYNPQEHFVVYFLRSKMLAAWFQPNKKIALTLYYSVPNDLDNVKIQFYKLPSILINLKKQ